MSDKVLFNDGDQLSEQNLAQRAAKSNQTDYVERGMSVTPNGDGTIDIGSGHAVVRDADRAWDVFPDPRAGLPLQDSSGTNHVFLTFDAGASDVDESLNYHIDADGSEPSTPSLLIAIVDAGAGAVAEQNSDPSISAEQLNTKPLKVGYWTDSHWGNSSNNSFVSQTALEAKIDEFAADMNSWGDGGADLVILGGDITTEDNSSQSNSQQRITDFRDYLEGQLNDSIPYHMVWGNHEFANAGTWDYQWSYGPWGISEDSDTYYSIDKHHGKIIVLNTGFNDGSEANLDSSVPSGQFDWFKNELESTNKPVYVFTHTPIPPGTHSGYDNIGLYDQAKYGHLIDQHDNIELVTFGHSHHLSNFGRSPSFDHSLVQRWGQTPYFYQHFPHGVGITGTDFDGSVTPYGKLHIYQDGHWWMQQSYAGDDTDYRTDWQSNGGIEPTVEETWESLSWGYQDAITSLDGYQTTEVGSNSAVTIQQTGRPHYQLDVDNSASGNKAAMMMQRSAAPLTNAEGVDWADMVLNVVCEIDNMTDFAGHIGRGFTAAGGQTFVGLYFNSGNTNLWASDGTDFQTGAATLPNPTGGPTHYQIRMTRSLDRISASVDHNTENGAWMCDEHVPPLDNSTTSADAQSHLYLFNAEARTKSATAQTLRIYDWNIEIAPRLNMTV
ncbi:metallophosphoesterase [Halosimplex rubrum]|uniref:Metallophosphoesterase n=1 Tax=Halosimplex rubrum TaxID=869889 RepID=A0A7D5SRJ3_9EURY|nr:metallophosphoesterase [Halosimplex rubrum]QLH78667.1 metallophosphoesterase [Halosimplex rubrum]